MPTELVFFLCGLDGVIISPWLTRGRSGIHPQHHKLQTASGRAVGLLQGLSAKSQGVHGGSPRSCVLT